MNKPEKEPQPIEKSMVIYNNTLYEQIYNPIRKISYYLGWDEQKQETIMLDDISDGIAKYIPINDEALEKRVVILPTNITEYADEKTLDKEISCFIYTWVDLSPEHLQKATWYIKLTWVIDNLHTIPYLRALGDYGTGKTRYEDVIGGLCYKPMFVGGAVRTAPIYRVIDRWRGTAIFDEFTLNKSDETEEIIKILNNGFQRGKPVIRCSGDNYEKVKYFDPFCPKILSCRKQFNDHALESRCITEVMKETDRTDIPIDLTKSFFDKQMDLRNKLLLFRFKNWNKIKRDDTLDIDFGYVQPRIKQSFLPFTVLFNRDKETLDAFIKEVQLYNNKLVYENSTNMDGLIVNCYLKTKEYDSNAAITSQDIRNDLVNNHGYKDTLNVRNIGKHLKALGFESVSKKVDGATKRVIEINDIGLKHLIYRYVPLEDQVRFLEAILKICKQTKIDGEVVT